tara:strand:+ start:15967 stop:16995 length:1029 start_codon:yes stop_codon:yes gene_type:complete
MIKNKKLKILVRVDGGKSIGLGHVYNMITILNKFRNNEILILMDLKNSLGKEKFTDNLYNVKYFSNKKQLFEKIKKFKPDIIFNDILNTKIDYMKKLREIGVCIVNFEDAGNGRKVSDLVINPIFSTNMKFQNEYYGGEFACVRDEFRVGRKNRLRKKIKKICITLGGVDNKNNTQRIMEIIQRNELLKDVEINLILGFGFRYKIRLMKLINLMRKDGYKINIIEKTDFISRYIVDCDFVISSNGRTIFEIASLGNPIIALSVNARETEHSFVKYTKTGYQINTMKKDFEKELVNAINKISVYKTRKKFFDKLKKINVKNGIEKVFLLIKLAYEKKEREIKS